MVILGGWVFLMSEVSLQRVSKGVQGGGKGPITPHPQPYSLLPAPNTCQRDWPLTVPPPQYVCVCEERMCACERGRECVVKERDCAQRQTSCCCPLTELPPPCMADVVLSAATSDSVPLPKRQASFYLLAKV